MPWINRSVGTAPRNGTTSHSFAFTPASAGSLLVAAVSGAVTSTTPPGWTLPANGAQVNNGGLYLFTKTAAAGESSFTSTHNGPDYPVNYAVYEFASGSVFRGASGDTGVSSSFWSSLSGLPGVAVDVFGLRENVVSSGVTSAEGSITAPWVEDWDLLTPGTVASDGVHTLIAYQEGVTATSATPVGSTSATGTGYLAAETITFAVQAAVNTSPTANAGPDQVAVEPYSTVTLAGSGSDTDGSVASYLWRVVSQPVGSAVALSSTTTQNPTFTAPATLTAGGAVVLGLRVTDDDGAQSTEDTVTVTVLPHDQYARRGGAWVPQQELARRGGAWI